MHSDRRYSFGLRRQLLVIGLLVLVPPLLLLLSAHMERRDQALAAAEAEALTAVREVAQGQERVIRRLAESLIALSGTAPVRVGTAGVCGDYLTEVMLYSPDPVSNLIRVDAEGRVTCAALSGVALGEPLGDLSAFDWFEFAPLEHPVISEVLLSPTTGEPIVAVVQAMFDQGQIIGYIGGGVYLEALERLFAADLLPPGSEITLVDRSNNLLARAPQPPPTRGQPDVIASAVREQVDGQRVGLLTLANDPDHLYAFYRVSPIEASDLLVYARVPWQAVYGEVYAQSLHELLVVLGVFTLLLGAFAYTGSVLVVRPLTKLAEASRRLGRGDLSARAGLGEPTTEVTEVGATFDAMAERLQERDATLRRLNRVYAVLSAINGLIVRANDRQILLDEACRICVKQGGFAVAWIGLLDPQGTRFIRVYSRGRNDRLREALAPTVGAEPRAWPELALPEDKRIDLFVYPPADQTPHWQRTWPGLDWSDVGACAAMPLRVDRSLRGYVVLYTASAAEFNASERNLLEELAADISLSLTHIERAERLNYAVSRDLLTGLPNANAFREQLALALRLGHGDHATDRLAVLLVDVSGLRDINSVHGLHVGDRALKEAARRLARRLPEHGVLARLRSSLFAVLVPEGGSGAAMVFVERLVKDFEEPLQAVPGQELYLAVRIGISIAPEDSDDPDMLIRYAETALGSLRRQAGEFRFYWPELQRRVEHDVRYTNDLRGALERGEFFVVYQPVVSVHDHRLHSVETLVRWNHPERGELSPADFIPLAEASGLIAPLGEWILSQACEQAVQWARTGVNGFKVAVNVSASQLRDPRFLEMIDAVLERSGANTHSLGLELEITENELMENAESTVTLLEKLRQRGLTLSMDDFGTGYSSLAYLKRFPLDTVKIDVAFIRELATDPVSMSIVKAIIGVARALDLRIIAEGVETTVQLERLEDYGCDYVQGFLFATPLPPEQIAEMASTPIGYAQSRG